MKKPKVTTKQIRDGVVMGPNGEVAGSMTDFVFNNSGK
jgi:hypothetical protein